MRSQHLLFGRAVESDIRRAFINAVRLPPSDAALGDSGYSLRGSGPSAITCSLGSPEAVFGEVVRLSPAVVWVIPRGLVTHAYTATLSVFLEGRGVTIGPLTAALIRRGEMVGSPVGFQLSGVTVEQGRQILSLLADARREGVAVPVAPAPPVQDSIEQADRIHSMLAALGASGNQGVLRRLGHSMSHSVRVVLERVDSKTSQLEWRTGEPVAGASAGWGEAPYGVDLIGYNSAYRLRLDEGAALGDRLVTPLPERISRLRHRWHRRVPAPAGVRARFHHPVWRELGELQRDVVDLSFSGLGIRCETEDLVFPGLAPLHIELETGDGQTLTLRGEIRHVSPRADGHLLCGLSVQPSSADEARWVRFVAQAASPATRTSEHEAEGLWDVFTLSGFLDLAGKPAAEFEHVRLACQDMAKRGPESPQLFCQVVWPSERGLEATFSSLKAYRHGWLLHQLAKRPGKPSIPVQRGQILRDLYLRVCEHPQSDPDFRWLVSYVESLSPWIAKAHLRYAERQLETGQGLAFTRQVRMLDVFTHEPTGRSHDGIEIGLATSEELTLLAAEIARTRPACYVDALDFSRERIDLRPIQARWAELGFERERAILVARRCGVPVAATVLELGQRGTNVYRLMDMSRLFSLNEAGPATYVALVDAARRWYAARGRTSFHFLCEDDGDYVQEAGIHGGPSPFLWIISSQLIPDFLEYIHELTHSPR
ncbi:MAG: PilZ domain-containing protein [Kofleriaceae bacterium]